MPKTPNVILAAILLGWAQIFLHLSPVDAGEEIIFGFHPFLNAEELVHRFEPLATYLEKIVGKKITMRITKNYQEHIDSVGENKVDLAYLGPVQYVRVVEKYGPKTLLACLQVNHESTFRGIIFTRQDSPIATLADLRGKKMALGEKEATMSTLVPIYMMFQAGVHLKDLDDYQEVGNHQNIALSVLLGQFNVGAIKEDIFYHYQKRGLKAIAFSPPIALHVITISPNIDPKWQKMWQEALYQLSSTEEGIKILYAIDPHATAFVATQDNNFANLRQMLQTIQHEDLLP